jgi:hypothetical protein
MIVYYNANQNDALERLQKLHTSANSEVKNFNKEIANLRVKLGKKNDYVEKTQIGLDGLLGALRRIEWAYNNFNKAPIDPDGHDEREAFTLVFFHNFRCFIEIIRKTIPNWLELKNNKKVFGEITSIRHFFAHSYDKDFLGDQTFVRININNHLNEGLHELEIFDLDSAEKRYGLFFSLEFYASEALRLIKALSKYIEKN